jgi:hypothetical protein
VGDDGRSGGEAELKRLKHAPKIGIPPQFCEPKKNGPGFIRRGRQFSSLDGGNHAKEKLSIEDARLHAVANRGGKHCAFSPELAFGGWGFFRGAQQP